MSHMPLIDTHCHLTAEGLRDEVEALVARAQAAGLTQAITIGTGCDDGEAVLDLLDRFPNFLAGAVGIDPFTAHAVGAGFAEELSRLETLLQSGRFCALGEIGLDYHYDLGSVHEQAERCAAQLALARRFDLPVVIHVREAIPDMLALLGNEPGLRGVIHSFTGDAAAATAFLALGFHLSFNGIVTFKNADAVRAAAAICPADRLLIETDSPYLAPVPLRGKRCEPALLVHTHHALATWRGERSADLAAWTTRNACALFGCPTPAQSEGSHSE